MNVPQPERRLSAILVADVVGYTRLVESDEVGTLAALRHLRLDVLEPLLAEHRGRLVKMLGDGFFAEFGSVVGAVACAAALQRACSEEQAAAPTGHPITLRIGINLGDVVDEDGDLLGDAVNIAARLEQLCPPGGVLISGAAHDQLPGKLDVPFQYLGEQRLKNIVRPIRAYQMVLDGSVGRPLPEAGTGRRPDDDRKRVAAVLKDYLARERISREQFAFKTKLGKSTVDKLLTGLFSDRTLSIVESHTKLPLRAAPGEPAGELLTASAAATSPVPATQPSIAVLPFSNMNGDPEQDFLADGLSEDIITGLTRLRWLLVIARNSSFIYKGRVVDPRQVARELGVRYVLEGSIRTAGERVRITGQLIDAETGKHIWAEKYDRDLQDIFAVQDDITERVVAAVEPHLYAAEGFKALTRPPESIDVWGLAVRAMTLLCKVERRANEEARKLLERAIATEPRYARAHALLGWAMWWASLCLWFPDRAEGYRIAGSHAQEALQLDPNDPWARMVSGLTFSSAGQHERALGELGRALSLNPSFALGHTALGWALVRAGWFEEAVGETEWALRMSPVDSLSGLYTTVHGLALLSARRFDEALSFLRAAANEFPEYSGHLNTLISCCGHLGMADEARDLIAVRDRIGPPLRLSWIREHLAKFAHCEIFVEGLRKAGVPE
jgi:TolB-like protein/class 3 adenylate cyclase/Tfp pilus assembly protein PilF